jgi:hypothetical protein
MDTRHQSDRLRAGSKGSRTSSPRLPDVAGILASQQLPGLAPGAADRIRRALAAESASRVAAAGSDSQAPLWIPQPRAGTLPPALGELVPQPRTAEEAA